MLGLDSITSSLSFLQNREDVEENNNAARIFADNQYWSTQNFNREMFDKANAYNTEMSNTKWQRSVADIQAAGLNPMLAYQQGPGNAPTSAQTSGSNIGAATGQPSIGHPTSLASSALMYAQEKRTEAETKEIDARTQTYPVQIDVMKSQIEGIKSTIEKQISEIGLITSQTTQSAAQTANIEQSTDNLKALIPQINATVKQLQAQTTLTYADAKLRGLQGNLTEAQWNETNQRIAANLPAVQAALTKAQEFLARMSGPAAQNQAGLHTTPLGALSTLLKAFNPLTGLISGH